jgi:hypothetical protein
MKLAAWFVNVSRAYTESDDYRIDNLEVYCDA